MSYHRSDSAFRSTSHARFIKSSSSPSLLSHRSTFQSQIHHSQNSSHHHHHLIPQHTNLHLTGFQLPSISIQQQDILPQSLDFHFNFISTIDELVRGRHQSPPLLIHLSRSSILTLNHSNSSLLTLHPYC